MAAPVMPDRVNVPPEVIWRQAREARRQRRLERRAGARQTWLYRALALNAFPRAIGVLGFGGDPALRGLARGVRAADAGREARGKVLVFCWQSTDEAEADAYRAAETTPYRDAERTVADLATPRQAVVFFRNPGPRGTDVPDWAWAIDIVRGTLPDLHFGLFVHFGDSYKPRIAPELEQLSILTDDRTRIVVARANETAGQNVLDVLGKQGWRSVALNYAGSIVLCQR